MKQPKSQSMMRGKLTKRLLLPTVRNSKTQAKLQQIEFVEKNEIYVNMKLLPCDIFLTKQPQITLKIFLNSSEISVYNQSVLISREGLKVNDKEWISINFGQVYDSLKIRKMGDENTFGKDLLVVESAFLKSSLPYIIELKKLIDKPCKASAGDKNKEMKNFISTLMNKKISDKRGEQKSADTSGKNLNIRKCSGFIKSRLSGYVDPQLEPQFSRGKISGHKNGLSSFRRDVGNQSKYTKYSEKQTNVSNGDHSNFHSKGVFPSNITIDSQDYIKKKLKLDTQPYFQNTGSFRSSEYGGTLNCLMSNTKLIQNDTALDNKSLHKSEEEESVEEQIKRSGISISGNQFQSRKMKNKKEENAGQESSSCYETRQLDSNELPNKKAEELSGTLYESKYQ